MTTRPEALLWDLGNTLADWNPDYLYRKLIPGEQARAGFLASVCTMAWHTEHDRGVPMAEHRRALIAAHPHLEALIIAWDTRWDEMFNGYIAGMEGVVEAVAGHGIAQHALSNMPAEKWPAVRRLYPSFERFEVTVISGEEGVIKPDPAIYRIAQERIATPPHRTLFIDDRPENVDAAIAAGFMGHHFRSADHLKADLGARGILV
ncbi:MAG: HAD family hydrolase [Glycocaulis sp.]